jgi:hypothetical protein
MSHTIAIHQPEYFPWLGFMDKARQVDTLVLLDSVQFDRSSLQNRAKVLGPNGLVWLTIPFRHKYPQRIDEVAFSDTRWASKHWKSLQAAYGKAKGFAAASSRLERYFAAEYPLLAEATIASTLLLLDVYGVTPKTVVRSSELGCAGDKADLVLDICRKTGATRYVSGRTGASYLAESEFGTSGIELVVQSFAVPAYPRRRSVEEEPGGLSALDAWLELGDSCRDLLGDRE